LEELSHQNCSFSVALSHTKIQDSPPLKPLPLADAMWWFHFAFAFARMHAGETRRRRMHAW